MACQRKDDGAWVATARIGGRRFHLRIKARTKAEAERIEREWRKRLRERLELFSGSDAARTPFREALEGWIRHRGRVGVANVESERTHLVKHVLPHLGDMPLGDVRRRHAFEVVDAMKAAGLAPRTIRNAHGTAAKMWQDLVDRELLAENPWRAVRRHVPEITDADPERRVESIFTHDELATLISDERIPPDRRVLAALMGLAGMRPGEAFALRWRHVDLAAQPLGRFTIARSNDGKTKTRRTRLAPCHPALAAILSWWREHEWPARWGRAPGGEDLVVPGPPGPQWLDRTFRVRFQGDLRRLGLRLTAGGGRRGPHGLRATFLTLAVQDGAVYEIVDRALHTPRGDQAGLLYLRPAWESLCREVAKLKIEPPAGCGLVAASVGTDATPEDDSDFPGSGGGTRTRAIVLLGPLASGKDEGYRAATEAAKDLREPSGRPAVADATIRTALSLLDGLRAAIQAGDLQAADALARRVALTLAGGSSGAGERSPARRRA